MLLTPASRTQKTKARAFVTICWVDRIETNKISKNVGFFSPHIGRNLWVCWVWSCEIMCTDKSQAIPVMQGPRTWGVFCFSLQFLHTEKEYGRQKLGKLIEITYWQRWYGYQTEYRSIVSQKPGWWQFLLSTENIYANKGFHCNVFCRAQRTLLFWGNPENERWAHYFYLMVMWFYEAWENEDTNVFDPRKIVRPLSGSHSCRERCSGSPPCIWPGCRDIISA